MPFHVVIPARYESTRFPGKPLIDLAGKSMIRRVYEQAMMSRAESVVVATDDQRVADEVLAFSGQVVMTSADHQTGTDRIHEAVSQLALDDGAVIVNVQGDEPLIPPGAIDQVAGAVSGSIEMATLCERIDDADDVFNPNIVKVVADDQGCALYFSRAPIPWHRGEFAADNRQPKLDAGLWFRHIGIYAYTARMLSRFVAAEPARLEQAESLEQLRVLAMGEPISVLESGFTIPPGIDTPEDVDRTLQAIMSNK